MCALGLVARRQGDRVAARSRYRESLALRRELGDRRGIAECLEGLAEEDRGTAPCRDQTPSQGQPERAARLLGAAEALRTRIGAPLPPHRRPEYETHRAALRVTLGEAAYTAAWSAGRALTWEEAVAEALGETALPVGEAHPHEPSHPAPPEQDAATDLTDAQWEQLRPLLPPPSPRGRRPTNDRRTLNGILYLLHTRCRWQDLPRRYGSPTTCWRRYARWQADGTWERLRRAAPGIPDAVE